LEHQDKLCLLITFILPLNNTQKALESAPYEDKVVLRIA